MTRLLSALVIAGALAVTLQAASFDFEQITVDNTAGGKALTTAKVTPFTISVFCRVRTAEISFLKTDPSKTAVTASVGMLAEPGDVIPLLTVQEMQNFRAIRTGSTSGQLDCAYTYSAVP